MNVDPSAVDLRSLIGPDGWREFAACYREKRFGARPEAFGDRVRTLWSDWEFEALCRFTPLVEADSYRMITRGRQVPRAAYQGRDSGSRLSMVRQLWTAGTSVNFARLELFSHPVLALIRDLEAECRCPVRAHYFATPPHAQALGLHADHDDALILQVQGEKTWEVYPEAAAWSGSPEVVTKRLNETTPLRLTLRPGGWLFLPRGVYHQVRNGGDQPSTHFTLGFHALSWGQLLEDALGQARRELGSLRDTLPVGPKESLATGEIQRRVSELQTFVGRVHSASDYGVRLPATELTPRSALDAASPTTRFRWRDGVGAPRSSPAGLVFPLAFRSVPLVLCPDLAPIVAEAARRGAFTPSELPGEGAAALLLCRFLANVGILEIEPGDSPRSDASSQRDGRRL